MKVLFLDFDGVINSFSSLGYGDTFTPVCCKHLQNLMSKEPELKIVVSSSWRHLGLEEIKKILDKNGINKSKVIDVTGNEKGIRGHQIQCWLDKHPEVTAFAILDDEADMGDLKDKLVKTSSYVGLTSEHVDKVIKLLQSQ